jgi:hypothetical protein
MTNNLCEACRQKPIEIIESADDQKQPYRLCKQCHNHLKSYSLSPIEWYNLASIHGPDKHLLHDDLYDEDGTALQPEKLIEITPNSLAPTLGQVEDDLERLLDFATTRYFLEETILDALRNFNKLSILNCLRLRVSTMYNYHFEGLAYEICARIVGKVAEEFIRERWEKDSPLLFSLAEATAACLPFNEGFNLVLNRLKGLSEREIPTASLALAWFKNELTLYWIEENANIYSLSGSFGRLAAVSQLTWSRVEKWLDKGRPLSFIALDALNSCWNYEYDLLLKRLTPRLLNPEIVQNMTNKLLAYKEIDSVPKVRQNVNSIITNWGKICS